MRLQTILITLLASCHTDCDANYAGQYCSFIEPGADYRSLHKAPGSSGKPDVAVCTFTDKSRWYCEATEYNAACWPLGEQVRIDRPARR